MRKAATGDRSAAGLSRPDARSAVRRNGDVDEAGAARTLERPPQGRICAEDRADPEDGQQSDQERDTVTPIAANAAAPAAAGRRTETSSRFDAGRDEHLT